MLFGLLFITRPKTEMLPSVISQPNRFQWYFLTGLGLAFVREIALACGGTIEVRSTADEGTVFALSLPKA